MAKEADNLEEQIKKLHENIHELIHRNEASRIEIDSLRRSKFSIEMVIHDQGDIREVMQITEIVSSPNGVRVTVK